jgi:RNA 2',3'-cyclic 3'-phosphodiesterase
MVRAFIGAGLTEEAIDQLSGVIANLDFSSKGIKWVKPENLHITFKFLEDIDESQISLITDILDSSLKGHGSINFSIDHLGVFPTWKRPRIIWAGVSKGASALVSLSEKIEDVMQALNFEKEKRVFKPHITIGRIKSLKYPELLKKAVQTVIFESGSLAIGHVTLYQSILSQDGAKYEVLSKSFL